MCDKKEIVRLLEIIKRITDNERIIVICEEIEKHLITLSPEEDFDARR